MLTLPISRLQLSLFAALGALVILSCVLAFDSGHLYLLCLPFLLLVVAWGILHYKSLYFFLLAMLPCSVEYYFNSSLATDLPTEPLMIGLMFVTFLVLAQRCQQLPRSFFLQPIILSLCLHYGWIFITAMNSENLVVSLKIWLAKTWYITTFTILTALLLRTANDLRKLFWSIFIPMVLLTLLTNFRHGLYGFSFADINKCVTPYFRNHVNYAAILSVFFPLIILARSWYPVGSWLRRMLSLALIFYVFAIYFSFTRTAMLAMLAMIPFYFVIRWKMTRFVLIAVSVLTLAGSIYIMHDNHFMKFAPDFQTTIYHDDFGSHMSSTFEGKDVSSMERVYRWLAAARMVQHRPWMGVGPGNFYAFYKSYTVNDFATYLSENEERSTVHNYFLLILVEQGVIGLFIFVVLLFVIFIHGEKIYWKMTSAENRKAVMCLLLMLVSVYVNLLLSDMLESDKVGPFFFMALGMLASFDRGSITMKAT